MWSGWQWQSRSGVKLRDLRSFGVNFTGQIDFEFHRVGLRLGLTFGLGFGVKVKVTGSRVIDVVWEGRGVKVRGKYLRSKVIWGQRQLPD